jgi:hypothetical protein
MVVNLVGGLGRSAKIFMNNTEIQIQKENRKRRERRERRDKGCVLLTERDEVVIAWIGAQYAVRLDQLRRLLGRNPGRKTKAEGIVGTTTAQSVVERWLRAGLVEAQKFRVKEPSWIWLTSAGLRQAGLDYYYKAPKFAMLEHTFWVNQVRLTCENRWHSMGQSREWIGERRLRRDAPRGRGRPSAQEHVPDAVVETSQGRVAIEVELTPKKAERLKSVMSALAGEYAGVWYFYNRKTKTGVEKCAGKLGDAARNRFRLIDLGQLS